jgi:hypothetical protein
MRRISAVAVLLLFGLMVALGAAGSAAAAGSQDTRGAGPDQAQIQKCLGNAPITGQPPTCTFDSNGNLIGRSTPGPGGHSLDLAPFVVLVVLWSVVPMVIAVAVAQSRGEPVGTAVLLILVLGWIGLFIVLYGQRRAVDDVGRLVNQSAPSPPPATPPPTSASSTVASETSSDAVGERLGTLDTLCAQGVITADERDRRRAAILDEV